MKTYKITLTFTDPYIGSRNSGNRIVLERLSLNEAKIELLNIFNRVTEHYSETWSEAKRKTKNRIDSAYGTGTTAMFYHDSRIYKIEAE